MIRIKPKTVHFAAHINDDGGVSALCFKQPKPIDLKKASWSLLPKHVNCARCRKLIP